MIRKNEILIKIFRIILGIVFLYSAYSKLKNPLVFSESIYNYQILGMVLSAWAAVLVPVLEGIVGVGLITGLWLRESLILTAALYMVFDLMILQAMIRGLDIDCGCFSPGDSGPIDIYKIMQNVILTAMAFWALFQNQRLTTPKLKQSQ
ncbi:MAG: DoxX family membrane protein [Calditrichia bacterium]|nr:DoxX family membrane protein [Calditrichia bacterium]